MAVTLKTLLFKSYMMFDWGKKRTGGTGEENKDYQLFLSLVKDVKVEGFEIWILRSKIVGVEFLDT